MPSPVSMCTATGRFGLGGGFPQRPELRLAVQLAGLQWDADLDHARVSRATSRSRARAPAMSSGFTRMVPRNLSPNSPDSSQRDTIISLWAACSALPRCRSGMMPRPIGCRTATSTPRFVNSSLPTNSGSEPGYCRSGPSVFGAYSPPGAPYQSIS